MRPVLTPSVVRCPGSMSDKALLLNGLGCERVHIDVSMGRNHPGLFELSCFGRRERGLFVSRTDFHVFPIAESSGTVDLPLQEGDRIVVHSLDGGRSQPLDYFSRLAKDMGVSFGVSVGVETPVENVIGQCHNLDLLMILTIPAGSYGLPLSLAAAERIMQIRRESKIRAGCKLGVDGGVNEQTFEIICRYADVVVVGGLLFNAPDRSNQWRALLQRAARAQKGN